MAMLGRLGRRLDGLGLFVGIAGVLGAAYTLTGRPPDVFLMRGLGLRSIAVAAASEALFLWALWAARRRVDRASRAGRILTIAGALVSVGALAVMLRHPLTGAYEFPHRHWEIIATRLALLLSALPFVALWCLPALARAVAATVVPNATRGQALGALVRHGWQRSRGLLANLALSG